MTDRNIGLRAVAALLAGRGLTLEHIRQPQTEKDIQTRKAAIKTLALNGWDIVAISEHVNMKVAETVAILKEKMPAAQRRMKAGRDE